MMGLRPRIGPELVEAQNHLHTFERETHFLSYSSRFAAHAGQFTDFLILGAKFIHSDHTRVRNWDGMGLIGHLLAEIWNRNQSW